MAINVDLPYLSYNSIVQVTTSICPHTIIYHAGAAPLVATDFFGRGDGPIAGNNVVCRGDEDGIIVWPCII